MKGLAADLRHAVRLYGRTPGSSAIAVVVLAVGMAFVAAFLSLYIDLVLRPHPGFEQSGADHAADAEPVVVISHSFWRGPARPARRTEPAPLLRED